MSDEQEELEEELDELEEELDEIAQHQEVCGWNDPIQEHPPGPRTPWWFDLPLVLLAGAIAVGMYFCDKKIMEVDASRDPSKVRPVFVKRAAPLRVEDEDDFHPPVRTVRHYPIARQSVRNWRIASMVMDTGSMGCNQILYYPGDDE